MPRKKARQTGPTRRLELDPKAQRNEPHVSEEVMVARLDAVEILLASGATSQQIADHCKLEYGIEPRTSRDYVGSIRARWIAEAAEARPESRRKLERMLEICYQAAMSTKPPQVHGAIRAAVELARLHGLYRPGEAPDTREPDQHTHLHAHATVVQIDARGMTPIERNAEIARLEERRRLALAPRPPAKAAKQRLEQILEGKGTP